MIKRYLVVILVFTSVITSAQRNNSSPYSFFGIGENFTPKTVEQASMGGIGVAMKDSQYLNFVNPAANADLRFATYSLGGVTSFLNLKETNRTQSGNSTSLSYISLGFPIGDKAGFIAGLQPSSSVGYALLNQTLDGNDVIELTRYTGDGGTNRLYASYGMYLFDGFSVGLEGAFIFGKTNNSTLNQRANVSLATKYKEETTIRGSEFKIGAQYKIKLKNKLEFSSGIAIKLSNDLIQRGNQQLYSLTFGGSGVEIPRDTLFLNSVRRTITNPLKTIAGFGIGKENKWYVGVNSEYQKALSFSDNFQQESTYKYENGLRTSIGGYYIPKINSISSYWDRVTYRAGLRMERTGLLVDGTGTGNNFTSINDFGINVGLGLPLPRQISSLNLGLEYGQKGTTNNNLIKENYFNVRLSLSLNSLNWFQKREID
ncbi:hypothetical protein C7447_10348 [Tenacibaculum adriaticum]|uniref:Long-subunit fatty acid transport protein n=1 Tax=Tenacibaculum adriaticum TaxID=413713 RepID=A0A5S5DSP5_9FLAO|nr:hypothetical protein [Tenacibaculum adriaticum]TYP97882.1 hypothetical protein C7447_10348 [Tenacibaculum adriaticum]